MKLPLMKDPKKASIVHSFILHYKRLFSWLKSMSSISQSRNFIIVPKLPFKFMTHLLVNNWMQMESFKKMDATIHLTGGKEWIQY